MKISFTVKQSKTKFCTDEQNCDNTPMRVLSTQSLIKFLPTAKYYKVEGRSTVNSK